MTRVHFETEFEALKNIFSKLTQVRLTITAIRPFFEVASASKTAEDKACDLKTKFQAFIVAHNELLAFAENMSPFYPEEIYDSIDECRKAASAEIFQLKTSGRAQRR